MADPLRQDEPSSAAEGRDARIEELLLAGLDHYFTGQHELAINVWTRVLFLDRSHARARAYIERARSAVAERQREGEELLQTGMAAFQRGDAEDARRLLRTAVDRGVSPDEAMALLDRLDRIAFPVEPAPPARSRRPWQSARAAARPSRGGISIMTLVLVLGIGAAAGASVVIYFDAYGTSRTTGTNVQPVPATPRDEALPIATSAAVTLTRAKALQASGRLREAVAALETVREGDPLRDQADQLRGVLQDELLRQARAGRADARPPAGAAPR
jgi:tetratricopeptide (TPR) repeat protein